MIKQLDVKAEKAKATLLALKEELIRLVQSSKEGRQPVELDQTAVGRLSRMDALQGQAMALEQARRRELEITRIESALKRIESGDYGYCLSCDEEVEAKRLELDPTTPTCISCAGAQSN
ncbi:MAG: TraR/DksA family transcriptional regulator [Rhodospirillales bacterium]|jgi:DnaK suppressor protein